MPKINVESSIVINASSEKIRDALIDFNTWPIWSPWLYMEPESEVTFRGEVGEPGHGYDWQGIKTGAGGMTLLSSSAEQIQCDLQFLKPFKSTAKVAFDIEAAGNEGTKVTWYMDSSLPFFLFWMKSLMVGMIKSDYNRGLELFKDYIETGAIPSSTTVEGVVDVPEFHYIGTRAESAMAEIASSMNSSYQQLKEASIADQYSANYQPLCFYNSMNMKTHRCDYTAAIPTDNPVAASLPLISATNTDCRALKVVHKGPYRHLGNAWAMVMAEAREK